MAKFYGVATNYERNARSKRDHVTVWTGPFMSEWVADGVSRRNGGGYMLTAWDGATVRVSCPTPRTDDNYLAVDAAISDALAAYYTNREV